MQPAPRPDNLPDGDKLWAVCRLFRQARRTDGPCDQREQQLSQADQQRRRLLEAVLAEALEEPEKALAAMTREGLGSHAVFSVDS